MISKRKKKIFFLLDLNTINTDIFKIFLLFEVNMYECMMSSEANINQYTHSLTN